MFHIVCQFFACFQQEGYVQSLLPYVNQKWTASQIAPQIWLGKHSITPGNLSKIWLRVREGNNSASHSMPESHSWWLYHLETSWGSHEWNFTQMKVCPQRELMHTLPQDFFLLCVYPRAPPLIAGFGGYAPCPLSVSRRLHWPPYPHKHGSEAAGGDTQWWGFLLSRGHAQQGLSHKVWVDRSTGG